MVRQEKIIINGIELFVKISGEAEETILLIHGSGMSSEYWMPQLEDKRLTGKYRLLAIDLPGHGKSAWSANPDMYSPDKLALLIEPLLKRYNVTNYILAGISFGTNIIGEMQTPLPGCKGIVLASACIVNDECPPSIVITASYNAHVIVTPHPSEEDLKGYAYHHEKNKEIADRYIVDYKNTDPNFRAQLGQMMISSGWSDELENIKKWNVPVCVVFGVDEPLLKKDYLDQYEPLWKKKVFLIENAGHMLPVDKPEEFNELLLQFSKEVFK